MGFGVPLDSEFFVAEGGKLVRIEGWVRTEGDVYPAVLLTIRPLSAELTPQAFRGKIEKAGEGGWARWHVEGKTEVDSLARLSLNIGRKNPKAEGDAWWDGINVKFMSVEGNE